MTGGSWQLSVGLRALGTLLPANQPKASKVTLTKGVRQLLSYGTSSGKADILIFKVPLTIDVTTAVTYDLYTGTDLKDVFGNTAALRKVKGIAVWVNSGGDATGVRIGGAASDAWPAFFATDADMHLIFPSGPPYLAGSPAGVAVGASTKALQVENLGAVAVNVGIAIAGTSA